SLMGAVNCVVREGDELVGDNTDGKGFLQSLRELIDPAGKRIVVLGAGGAARAITVELALAGAASIQIVNRNAERGQALASMLSEKTTTAASYVPWEGEYAVNDQTDVLINATSIGLNDADARVAVNFASALPELIVADVVF